MKHSLRRRLPAWPFFSLLAAFAVTLRVASPETRDSIRLTDVATEAGVNLLNVSGGPAKDYLLEVVGNGGAFFDHDDDLDLLVVNGSNFENLEQGGNQSVVLYRNDGEEKFSGVTGQSGLSRKGWGMGVCVADYDNDGFQDVYITAYGPNALFRNRGDGTFVDATERTGVGNSGWSTSCGFGDYDRDGYVDLYVARYVDFDVEKAPRPGISSFCQYRGLDVLCGPRGLPGEPDVLYHNNRDGSFTDATDSAGIVDRGYYGFGVVLSDTDNDGWLDIYVANDSTPNFLFLNQRDGTFTDVALVAGAALSEHGHAQAGMGVDAADYDGDGLSDIFVTNFSDDSNTLYQNIGQGTFRVNTSPTGLGASSLSHLAWGTAFFDLDNDRLLDLFIANGHIYPQIDQADLGSTFLQRNQLYRNLGSGAFHEVTDAGDAMTVEKSSRGAAFGDYDNDGDLDIMVSNLNDLPNLLRNDSENSNHWLTLRLVGTKSNRDAVGAKVAALVAGGTRVVELRGGGSYLSHSDLRVHFGLGSHGQVDQLEIRWPSGQQQTFNDIQTNQFLAIGEEQGIVLSTLPQR